MPEVKVHHIVPPHRLTFYYLMRRTWWQGVTDRYYLLTSLHYNDMLKITVNKAAGAAFSIVRFLLFPRKRRKWVLMLILQAGFFLGALERVK